ncbi:DUF4198 domain-containing protein [Oscillatoria amoena NRMC-F 0135]|nr:DUF4198 domain-containing protein [Oscillatoria amoena NRMC-F 0135]
MSMNRRAKALVLFFTVTVLTQAHEFWLQPDRFLYKKGEIMKLDFMVGEGFIGERWDLKKHRLIRFDHHAGNYSKGLIEDIVPEAGSNLEVKLEREGTHLFVMQSNNAFIELDAEKFNAYLKEDGLEDILEYRVKTNTQNKRAREYYQRSAKLLVQAGSTTDETSGKQAGTPIEIVPLKNPYALKPGAEMQFRVVFEGKPLAFTLVKVWNRKDNRTTVQNIYTEKDGTLTTRLSNTGMWMVSCVKMVPAKEEGADWQSYWGSLVFGF